MKQRSTTHSMHLMSAKILVSDAQLYRTVQKSKLNHATALEMNQKDKTIQ